MVSPGGLFVAGARGVVKAAAGIYGKKAITKIAKEMAKKEFQEIGCAIKVTTTEADIQKTLDEIASLATDNSMEFYGGGLRFIILPQAEDKNKEVPKKPAYLVENIAKFPDLFPDFVMGYLANAKGRKITESQKSAIREYISSLTVENDVNYECDLWN